MPRKRKKKPKRKWKKKKQHEKKYENNCGTTTATKFEENRPRGEGEKKKNFRGSRKQAVEIKEPVDPETGDRNYSTGDRPRLAALLITEVRIINYPVRSALTSPRGLVEDGEAKTREQGPRAAAKEEF